MCLTFWIVIMMLESDTPQPDPEPSVCDTIARTCVCVEGVGLVGFSRWGSQHRSTFTWKWQHVCSCYLVLCFFSSLTGKWNLSASTSVFLSLPAPQSVSRVIRRALWLPLIRPVWVLPLTALPACIANREWPGPGITACCHFCWCLSLCYPLQSDAPHLNCSAGVVETELLEIFSRI